MDPILERFQNDLYNSSDSVKKDRVHYARMWLDYAGDPPWPREKITAFLANMRRQNYYSDGTVRKVYGIVKRVVDAAQAVAIDNQQKLIASIDPSNPDLKTIALAIKALGTRVPTWDMGKRAAPKITKQNTPTLTLGGLKARIEAVKEDGGVEAGFLALSSVYGLRRGELQRIRPEDFDWDTSTLFVHTEKGGDQRKQLLASAIVPLLKECDFSRQYSDFGMSKIWWQIEQKAGIDHELDTNWHAARRYANTCLREIWGEDAIQIKIFMRWRTSSGDISDRYYHRDPLTVDSEVLARHPVVELWEN
jgi:integrase